MALEGIWSSASNPLCTDEELPKASADNSQESGFLTSSMVFSHHIVLSIHNLRLRMKLLYTFFVNKYLGEPFLFAKNCAPPRVSPEAMLLPGDLFPTKPIPRTCVFIVSFGLSPGVGN